jgi:hypothetical protein
MEGFFNMMTVNIKALVAYRLEQADESLEAARTLNDIRWEQGGIGYHRRGKEIQQPQSIRIAVIFYQWCRRPDLLVSQ